VGSTAGGRSCASPLDILIERADCALTVQVRDDGGGADATRGSGLVGLRDRVEAVGGTMTLDSPARAGTILTVRLPVTAEDHLSKRTVRLPGCQISQFGAQLSAGLSPSVYPVASGSASLVPRPRRPSPPA
jgi:hypothetical protein